MEGPPPTLDDALQVMEQFLAGRVHVDLLLATITRALAENSAAAHPLQEKIDSAMRASELSEPVWERITAELDQAGSGTTATLNPEADATAPRPVEQAIADGAASPEDEDTAAPPVLDEPVQSSPTVKSPASKAMAPGTLLGDRYVIVSQALTGGMGCVYKALDRSKKESGDPDPWVAIKVIGDALANHPQALAALEREAENCKALQHDNIVQVFGFERDGDNCFITMEWLEGESLVGLLERARQKPPSATQLRKIILGLGAALVYAHSRGVTHADVKPGNVFITRDGAIKLLDFGVALVEAGETARELEARTPGYSSCEVLEGQDPVPADDVFSYSLLIYRLFGGKRAYGDVDALAAEASQLAPERITSLAEQAWQTLLSGLAFRRAGRPADVASFLEAFTAPPKANEATATGTSPAAQASAEAPAPTGAPTDIPADGPPGHDALPVRDSTAPEVEPEIDANADTTIAAMEIDEPRSRWTRQALIAASLVAGVAAGLWLWPDEPDTMPVTQSLTGAAAVVKDPPPTDKGELQPIAIQARRLEDVFANELDAADQPADPAPALQEVVVKSVALSAAEPELETAPKPDAQLASVVAAPAVSRLARPIEEEPAPEPAIPSPPPRPVSPATAPADSPTEPAGQVADTSTARAPEAAPALNREAPPDPGPDAEGPGGIASIGPPVPALAEAKPGDYGPAPAVGKTGPLAVPLSALDFDRFTEPRYPRTRAARNTRGWVEVSFDIDAEGETSNISLIDSTPPEVFDEAALKAVEKWRFKPHTVDGQAVAATSVVRLRFEPR